MIFRLYLIIGPLPNILVNGTTADATQVMADLNAIVNAVNANAAPLATTALTNANNNFTTVQSGQPATQPANFVIASQIENNSLQTLSSILGTNTITGRVAALPLGAYVSGQIFTFFPSNANTGAATLNIDGLGARSLLNFSSALSGAELQPSRPSLIAFDGAAGAFDLVNGTPYVKGPNIPSAATLNLDGTQGDYSQVDGTTAITAMTISPGRQKLLEFTSSPLLTKSGSLILPLASNILAIPGDTALIRGEPSGVARVVAYQRATGFSLAPFSGYFDSGPQTITAGGSLTLAHGLPGKPKLIQVQITNVSAELGYTTGQEVVLNSGNQDSATGRGVGVVPDATNVNIRYGTGANTFEVINFTTGVAAGITNANWTFSVRAWS